MNRAGNQKQSRDYDRPPSRDDIALGDLIGVFLENAWLIGLIAASVFALGVMYTFLATPIFRADGLIQVEEKKSGLGNLDINALFEGDTSVNAEIEILRSRLVLGAVVDNLKLDIEAQPRHFSFIGRALSRWTAPEERAFIRVDSLEVPTDLIGEPLTLVAVDSYSYSLHDSDENKLANGVVGEVTEVGAGDQRLLMFVSELRSDEGGQFLLQKESRLKSIENLQRLLVVREKGKGSGILSLSLEGENPTLVQSIVNEIANVYVRKNVERRSEEAEKTLSFLDGQLPAVKQDMETAEVALNTYRLEKGSVDLPLETRSVLEAIVNVESHRNELKQQRDKVTQGFTVAHPMVIGLDRQIERLTADLDVLNDQVRELPNTQQEVLRLVRDTQVNTELYTSLLNTAQELRVVKAGTVGNVRVVDYAASPYRPVKPNKPLLSVLFMILGGILGIVVAFVKRTLMGGVEDPSLIEKQLELPVYATIAHSKRQDRIFRKLQSNETSRAVLAIDSPDDLSIESLRNLRTTLHFCMMDVENNCIMISGPSPGVGKSFVSVNLATVLADSGKRVLLIDGDLRRGHLHRFLGLQRERGLSEFISGEIPIGEALRQTSIEGLTLIPTGKMPPNPAELLMHKRFTNCLTVLAPRFDHIIIDSPPILAATDSMIIGQMAGASLMVLKSGQHPMREIELAAKQLRQAGVNLRGFLVNDLPARNQRYGAGKYTYQYSYEKS